MALAVTERRYNALHEKEPWHDGTFESWRKDYSASHPYHYLDGVGLWVSTDDLTPDDDFLGDSRQNGG